MTFFNSTKSCYIDGLLGYSYRTAIVKVDQDSKKILVNKHQFSVTTSKHRIALLKFFMMAYPNFTVSPEDNGSVSY